MAASKNMRRICMLLFFATVCAQKSKQAKSFKRASVTSSLPISSQSSIISSFPRSRSSLPPSLSGCSFDKDCYSGSCTSGQCSCWNGWCSDARGLCTIPRLVSGPSGGACPIPLVGAAASVPGCAPGFQFSLNGNTCTGKFLLNFSKVLSQSLNQTTDGIQISMNALYSVETVIPFASTKKVATHADVNQALSSTTPVISVLISMSVELGKLFAHKGV